MIQYLLSHLYIFTALTTVWLMVEFLWDFFFTLTCMEWIFFLGFQHIWNITSGIYRWSHCIWWIFFRCLGFTITCFFLYIYTWATFNKLFICALPTKTVETLVYYIRIFKFLLYIKQILKINCILDLKKIYFQFV